MELDFLYSSISFLKKEEGYYVYSLRVDVRSLSLEEKV
jgi:hypothetical protein